MRGLKVCSPRSTDKFKMKLCGRRDLVWLSVRANAAWLPMRCTAPSLLISCAIPAVEILHHHAVSVGGSLIMRYDPSAFVMLLPVTRP